MLDRRINKCLHLRLPAAGIIEVIIAMLIICVVMIGSSILYARLLDGNKGMLRLKAESAAVELYEQMHRDKSYLSNDGVIHEMHYKKEITVAPSGNQLYHVCITITNDLNEVLYIYNALTRIQE